VPRGHAPQAMTKGHHRAGIKKFVATIAAEEFQCFSRLQCGPG